MHIQVCLVRDIYQPKDCWSNMRHVWSPWVQNKEFPCPLKGTSNVMIRITRRTRVHIRFAQCKLCKKSVIDRQTFGTQLKIFFLHRLHRRHRCFAVSVLLSFIVIFAIFKELKFIDSKQQKWQKKKVWILLKRSLKRIWRVANIKALLPAFRLSPTAICIWGMPPAFA